MSDLGVEVEMTDFGRAHEAECRVLLEAMRGGGVRAGAEVCIDNGHGPSVK